MNKSEIKNIKNYYKNFDETKIISQKKARGQIVNSLIVICYGRKPLHDSGFPFIEILGINGDKFFDLGWHDHFVSYVPLNIDCFGKNVFHVMPWIKRKYSQWKVSEYFLPTSSFMIGEYKDDVEKDEIILS